MFIYIIVVSSYKQRVKQMILRIRSKYKMNKNEKLNNIKSTKDVSFNINM